MNKIIPLKNCPICGSEAKLKVTEEGVYIECTFCVMRTKPLKDDKNTNTAVYATVDLWNRRIHDDKG